MPFPETYNCGCCMYWTGDREGAPTATGECKRHSTQTAVMKQKKDWCGDWKNCNLVHGGFPVNPPERP